MDQIVEPVLPQGVVFIPTKHAAFMWPLVSQHVDECLEFFSGEFSVGDIRDRVLDGKMQLFIVWEGRVKGVVLTEIVEYPQMKVLRGVIIHGVDFDNWMAALQAKLIRYQKYMGCDHIETVCRPGLYKKIKHLGWEIKQLMLVHRSY